ncbi:hypothetical protein CC78DRAFT_528160 [Lojkania enalia]|uniref:Uncharacterized protein n=1 Tax=Lojkania enalia TaxID=147567 RepID=A0A9P4NBV3_9PLEO|nr:hypothetical protein CC78DRAFT_528160 [Didymosphaeria enalia]
MHESSISTPPLHCTLQLWHADMLTAAPRRKYFSSLERLRFAEEHALQLHGEHSLAQSRCPSVARSHSIALHYSHTPGSTRRRLRKAESLRQEHDICQAEAQFFLSLPEKLRKQHFSREEQVLLAGYCEQVTAQDPALHRIKQRFNDFRFDFFDDSDSTLPRGRSRRRSTSVSPLRSPSTTQRQETENVSGDSPLFLDSMASPPTPQAVPSVPFRRTLSLTSLTFRHSTSSAPPLASPPLFSLGPQPWRPRASSQSNQSISGRPSSHAPAAPIFDPEATHYQDPEARKKLRMYLASPQKFDEAVEFGFPSTAGHDIVRPRYQLPPIATDARNFSKDMQTFLRDDKISFLEDTDDDTSPGTDAESITDVESPVTPSSIGLSFCGHTRHASPSNFSSLDSSGLPSMHPMAGRLNREMTLRMTLTRPDLRADEDQLYGWQAQRGSRDDPFALEELHLSDDMTGSKGAFAVKPKPQGNLVTRLFKRASRKGR